MFKKLNTDDVVTGEVEINPMQQEITPASRVPETTHAAKQIGDSEDNEPEAEGDFVFSHGLSSQEAKGLLEIHGRNELPEKKIPKWYIFLSQ
eukprot:gene24590-27807_t